MRKAYYKIYMSVFIGALISITPCKNALANPGDVINTSNKKTYNDIYKNKDVLNALIDDIINGNEGNEAGKADSFMTEGVDKKYYDSSRLHEKEKEAIRNILKINNIEINDATAVKAFMQNIENRNKVNEVVESTRNTYILEHAENINIAGFEEGSLLKATVDSQTNLIGIKGNITSKESKPVAIRVLDINSKQVYINQFNTDEKGVFEHKLDFMSNTTGAYTVKLNVDSLDKPIEKTFNFIPKGIKEVLALSDVEVEYGSDYGLPKTVSVVLDDGSKQEVVVVWDQIINTKMPGVYEAIGTIKGTEFKITLKVTVREQLPEAAAKEIIEQLKASISENKNLVDDKTLDNVKVLLEKAQEAVDKVTNKDSNRILQAEINTVKEYYNLCSEYSNYIKTYEELCNNMDYNNYEESDKLDKCYRRLYEILYREKDVINKVTRSAIEERYNKCQNTYDRIRPLVEGIRNNIYKLEEKNNKIQNSNAIKADFDSFENTYAEVADLAKKGLNAATQKSFENKRDKYKTEAASRIIVTQNFKEILGQDNVKLLFINEEITNFTSGYSIAVEDKDSYGMNIHFDASTGNISLNNDKGINDGKEYDQIVTITNNFWNKRIAFYVTIKDVPGADTISVGQKKVVFIYELEEADTVHVLVGENYELPKTVKAKYTDGTIKEVPVVWEGKADTSKQGNYYIKGSVNGTDLKAKICVSVREKEKIEKLEVLEPITFGLNEKCVLPDTIQATTNYGRAINAKVVWDKVIDTSVEGTYSLVGTVDGTELKASLKIIVRKLNENELAESKVKFFESIANNKNLLDVNNNAAATEALKIAQDLVNALTKPDSRLQGRIDTAKVYLDAANAVKPTLDKFVQVGLKDFSDNEVYRQLLNELDNVNKAKEAYRDYLNNATLKSFEDQINMIYQCINPTFPVKYAVNDLIGLGEAIEASDYSTIKAYEQAYNKLSDLSKVNINEATRKALETRRDESKLEASKLLQNALKVTKLQAQKQIKVTFAEYEIANLSSGYSITVEDKDDYGKEIIVASNGKLQLNRDKGKDNNKEYVQVIKVTNSFWNNSASASVIIKDVKGEDEIILDKQNATSIVSIEPLKDIVVTVDAVCELPRTVTVVMSDNTTAAAIVVWDKTVDTSREGTVELTGKVEGTDLEAKLKVIIQKGNTGENALKVEKGIDNEHIKVIFEGTEVSLDSNYELEVIDNGGYITTESAISISTDGKLELNSDIGDNKKEVYVQTIAITNTFWSNKAVFYVRIKKVQGEYLIIFGQN